MDLLLGPALRLILSAADLRALDGAILDKRSTADLDSLIEGNLLVLNEAVLPEVLLTLLLLLGLVVGHIGGVAPLVIAVVTLHHIIILGLFHHLHLVNATLTISTSLSSSNGPKAHINTGSSSSLTAVTGINLLDKGHTSNNSRSLLVMMVVLSRAILGIEGEGVDKGPLTTWLLHNLTPQLTGSLD